MNAIPLWLDSPRTSYPRHAGGTIRADVAVIGGGLTGLSAAYHLSAGYSGLKVVVVEANTIGCGASGRNTGMLSPGIAQSPTALAKHIGHSKAAALYQESIESVKIVRDLVEREGIDCDLQMTGQIFWARNRAGRKYLTTQAEWLSTHRFPVDLLDDSGLSARICLPRTPGTLADGPSGMLIPGAGILNPYKLVAGIAKVATARGAEVFENSCVKNLDGGHKKDKRICLNLKDGGSVIAEQVIIATAGYTSTLNFFRGRIIPLRLHALATEPLSAAHLGLLDWKGREGVVEARRIFNYFRLTCENRLVFGGGSPAFCAIKEMDGKKPPINEAKALKRELADTFACAGLQDIRVTHLWKGIIGCVLDGIPAIARCRDRPKIIHALGWNGHGLALGIAAGKWIAENLTDFSRTGWGGLDPYADIQYDPPAINHLAWFRDNPPMLHGGEAVHRITVQSMIGFKRFLDKLL